MNAKRFVYFCAGILMLAIAYGICARNAVAQAGAQFTGITVDSNTACTSAITSNGDVYARGARPYCPGGGPVGWFGDGGEPRCGWTYMGNVLGGPIQIEGKSMSDVKSSYRK